MKLFYSSAAKRGMPPGSAVYAGDRPDEPMKLTVINYSEEQLDEFSPRQVVDCYPYRESATTTWINVDGLSDSKSIEALGLHFGLHSLVIEDILHTTQRPKMEDLGEAIFLVVRMLYLGENGTGLQSEQVSFVLTPNALITFQEKRGDVFDLIRERIRNSQGRIRKKGVDYLLYALMDAIVDNYFHVMEHVGERIEEIEAAVMDDPYPSLLSDLYSLKRELLYIRKAVWPLREAVSLLERGENQLIDPKTLVYLRDLYDHTIQVIETVEAFRDMLSGVQDLYLSSIGNKTNQVMRVLTIIATLFIPLTFVAGIYGMNFENMPELHWQYGYPAIWVVMIALTMLMLYFFRRKKWL